MKVKQVIEIDYNELEDIVNKHFDITSYEFVAVQECGNYSSYSFNMPKAEPLDKWGLAAIELLKQDGSPTYYNHAIMQQLVNDGVLAPGEYLVKVSW